MPKVATAWKTKDGSSSVTAENAGFSLLLETDDQLLLETSDDLLLEDFVITPKLPAAFTTPTKIRTSWEARDGSSSLTTGVEEDRVTEGGDTRITEQGDTRETEDNQYTKKLPTSWTL